MARTGPNQDINNPSTIITLLKDYQAISDNLGNMLAISNSQNTQATGPPLVETSIPFVKLDSSTEFLFGKDADDIGIVNDVVHNSHIGTYIYLAERFRDYFYIFTNAVEQLNNFLSLTYIDIDPEGPFVVPLGSGITRTYGSLGGKSYTSEDVQFRNAVLVGSVEWEGFGPTSYNSITYPQLEGSVFSFDTIGLLIELSSWITEYNYDKRLSEDGGVLSATISFGKDAFISQIEDQYIQFYNHTDTMISISMTMSVIASFATRFSAALSSWAEIDDINTYPQVENKSLLPSFQSQTEELFSPGGVISLSDSRTVEIPPLKSAFIGSSAGAANNFGFVGSVKLNLKIEDKELTFP